MTVRPILFSAPMIRALLDGRKTQTRRVLRDQPEEHGNGECTMRGNRGPTDYVMRELCPRFWTPYRRGDILWVRESWSGPHVFHDVPPGNRGTYVADGVAYFPDDVWYWADGRPNDGDYECPRPSIHMPRYASRLTLAVTDVRVQRVQEISKADVTAEGITERNGHPIEECYAGWHEPFAQLWDAINGKRPGCAWEDDPWVVALTFDVHRMNVDAFLSRKDEAQ